MLDLSQRRELSLHAEVTTDVTAALDAVRAPGIVVGAFARDLHLHYGAGIPIQRATRDIDFAFTVSTWTEFEVVRTQLLASGSLNAVEGVQHRLRHRNQLTVDLVPFGRIETDDRRIAWPPTGDVVMDVFGFKESLRTAEQALLPGGINVSIVCLPALALLKIVAWEDRHRRFPGKDAADLDLVIRNYLVIPGNQQRLWGEFNEWTESPDFDFEHSGARMLGHDIRSLVDDEGLERVDRILRVQIDENNIGELPQEMDRRSPERALALLQSLQDGLSLGGRR